MDEAKKLARNQAKLAQLLGIQVPDGPVITSEDASREAEAVLAYYDDPTKFIVKKCKQCGEAFRVNRSNVAYCMDACRARALKAIGLTWDPTRTAADRWRAIYKSDKVFEPLVVPSEIATFIDETRPPPVEEVIPTEGDECGDSHTFEAGCEFYFLDDVTSQVG